LIDIKDKEDILAKEQNLSKKLAKDIEDF